MLAPDDEASRALVAVLRHGYWRARFNSDCAVVGKTLHIRGVAFTIIGVAAPEFSGIDSGRATDVWVPLQNRVDLNAWGKQDGTRPRVSTRFSSRQLTQISRSPNVTRSLRTCTSNQPAAW
jgi:hypothetical protein